MKQKKRKKLIIAILIIIAIAAVVAGVFFAMRIGGGGIVGGASSLQFSSTVTYEGTMLGNYSYMVKNVGTSNLKMRIATNDAQGNSNIYIIDGAQRKAWLYSDGQWHDITDAFPTQWATWRAQLKEYTDNLAGWTSGDMTYTASNGATVRVYDIVVNPSLADSQFQAG
jgi:hypothetical protein